jgi:DNA-directed RNA polymerase III subunit RPC6
MELMGGKDEQAAVLKVLAEAGTLDDKSLTQRLKGVTEEGRVTALNALIQANRVLVSENERGLPLYRYQSEENARRMASMDQEEFKVYEKIEEARDMGITVNDLKSKLQAFGFNQTVLAKILKQMEKNGLVKKIRSLQQKHRQVYMLIEVEPSAEVTGGLVNQSHFNLETIEVVQERVVEYLKSQGAAASYRELALIIKQTGLLQGDHPKDEHIRQIIDVLIFDQMIESVPSGGGQIEGGFRICGTRYPYALTYSGIPCAVCPIIAQCGPGNLVNPRGCEYMQDHKQA